jgi:hypothetical protein
MITCNLKGGLGNQLFQIFAIIAYSLKHGKPFKFVYTDMVPSITPRHSYWESFLKSLKAFTINAYPSVNTQVITYNDTDYRELPASSSEHTIFDGYFQSYKYFEERQNDIFRLIQLEKQKTECLTKYAEIDLKNTISLHFRMGDYKHLAHFHPIMGFNYYKNALTHILSSCQYQRWKVVYFCEAEDNNDAINIINSLAEVFPLLTFEKASDQMADWEQILVMSGCTHHIIANSSFSWFGAYFNSNKDKIVCYPNIWFGGRGANIRMDDLFPLAWKKIKC